MTKLKLAVVVAISFSVLGAPCLAETFIGPSGKPVQQAKCQMSPTGCYQQASAACHGPYQILDSERHSGGLFMDLMPGPVMWYSMTYSCGHSDGRLGTFELRGAGRVVPRFNVPAVQAPRAPTMTNCSRIGNSVTCYSN